MTLRKFGNKTQLKCIRTNLMYLLDIKNKMTKTRLTWTEAFVRILYILFIWSLTITTVYGFVKSITNLMKLSAIWFEVNIL